MTRVHKWGSAKTGRRHRAVTRGTRVMHERSDCSAPSLLFQLDIKQSSLGIKNARKPDFEQISMDRNSAGHRDASAAPKAITRDGVLGVKRGWLQTKH